jgi:hypothetical protein
MDKRRIEEVKDLQQPANELERQTRIQEIFTLYSQSIHTEVCSNIAATLQHCNYSAIAEILQRHYFAILFQ